VGVGTPGWVALLVFAAAVIGVVTAWLNYKAARERRLSDDSLRLRVSDLELKLRLAERDCDALREQLARSERRWSRFLMRRRKPDRRH
jgi:hypothetical protein